MLAKRRNILHVEFIERDDAIDGMASCCVAYGINQTLQGKLFRDGADFVDTLERPVGMTKLFDGQEKNEASHGFAGADEFLAIFVGTDAQNGERPVRRHSTPPWSELSRARIIQRAPARDTEIAETDQRAAPRLLRCAPRLRRARSASRSRASSLF